jgi:hypothetical protein
VEENQVALDQSCGLEIPKGKGVKSLIISTDSILCEPEKRSCVCRWPWIASGWCTTIKLLPVLHKRRDDFLPGRADHPLGEGIRNIWMHSFVTDQQVCGVEQEVLGIIGRGPVYHSLRGEVGWEREICAPVCKGVLFEEDCSSQGLDRKCNVLVVPSRICSCPGHLDGNG